jgi:hypothetical protein
MSYPPPPGVQQPYAPAPPPQRRRRWPWIVAGIVLLSIIGCIGLVTTIIGGTAAVVGEAANEMDANQQGKNAVAGEFGKPAKDGKFEFTVTGSKCGLKQVGGEFGSKPQGEYCVIDVTIKNVAATAEAFSDSSQQATDAKNNVYDVDSAGSLAANTGSAGTLFENINPGNQVKGKLVFDVPPGTKLASVVLHESMYTAGVRVPLK